MSKNLNRITAAENAMSALHDLIYVCEQFKQFDPKYNFLDRWMNRECAREIDRITRRLINWAKEDGIEIALPDRWSL